MVDFLRGDLLRVGVGADVNPRRLIEAGAQKRHSLCEHTAGVRAGRAFLDLGAVNALERKEIPAHVVEHLDGVLVQRVNLIAHFQQRHHGVGVHLAAAVLQRVHQQRVRQVGDDQELAVRRHPVAIDPDDINHRTQVRVGVLRQCAGNRIPEEQVAVGGDAQQVKAVVQRRALAVVSHIAQHRDRARSADRHELAAHHAVQDAVPVDPAPVWPRPPAVCNQAVSGTQVFLAHAAGLGHRHQVDRIRGADVRAVVGEDAGKNGDLGHGSPLDLVGPIRRRHLALGDIAGVAGLERFAALAVCLRLALTAG